jgi:uncharacterized protein
VRLRSFITVGFAALAIFVSGGPSTRAENDTSLMRDPTVQRGSFFGVRDTRVQVLPRQRQRERERVYVAPVQQRRATVAPVAVSVIVPKADARLFVVVLGDSLGELLATGLEEALGDRPDVAVVRKAKSDSGLVRSDYYDWPKAARELVASEQKMTLAVLHLGTNDRQSIREGDVVHEPLSERWKELYVARIDAVAAAFAERRVPLLWVGAPPVQYTRLTADLVVLNELFRQRVERAGGTYIDLWGGFVDAENRYTANGPDLSGQIARLRTADGIHYTRAGARKAAHFADVAIRRLLEADAPQNIAALPAVATGGEALGKELQPGGIERVIDAMVSGLPEATRLASIPVKPLAGPVVPLNQPAVAAAPAGNGTLLARSGLARGRGDGAALLDRIFGDGAPPEPKPGRADDYRWPKPGN